MKKILTALILVMLLLGLAACGKSSDAAQATPSPTPESEYRSESIYTVELDSFDQLAKHSTNIVKATLFDVEEFSVYVNVYHFRIDEDYTNNTPDEINMYDEKNDAYIIDHTYYLFLDHTNRPLYPHTIYTTIKKELILDVTGALDGTAYLAGENISLAEKAQQAVETGIVGTEHGASAMVTDETSITSVADQAEVIAEVFVSDERNFNRYASLYTIRTVEVLKGMEDRVPKTMSLPPELDPSQSYYIFLAPGPQGESLLFSREFPAVPASQVSKAELLGD